MTCSIHFRWVALFSFLPFSVIAQQSSIFESLSDKERIDFTYRSRGGQIPTGSFDMIDTCPEMKKKYPERTKFEELSENDAIDCFTELTVKIQDRSPSSDARRLSSLEGEIRRAVESIDQGMLQFIIDSSALERLSARDSEYLSQEFYSTYYKKANKLYSKNWEKTFEDELLPLLNEYTTTHSSYQRYLLNIASRHRELTDKEKEYLEMDSRILSSGVSYDFFDPQLRYEDVSEFGAGLNPVIRLQRSEGGQPDFLVKSVQVKLDGLPGNGVLSVSYSFPKSPQLEYNYNLREHAKSLLILGDWSLFSDSPGFKRESAIYRANSGEKFCRVRIYETSINGGSWDVSSSSPEKIEIELYVDATSTGQRNTGAQFLV